jgi:hypothetical protein
MHNFRKKFGIKLLAFALIATVGCAQGGVTQAYYSDTELSGENFFEAAELDFLLATTTTEFIGLTPENSAPAFSVAISTTTESLPFEYRVFTSATTSPLCGVLTLEAKRSTSSVYVGPLSSFSHSTSSFPGDGDSWDFITSLPPVDSSYANQTCEFDITFDGWQFGFSSGKAYHDVETESFAVTTAQWEDIPETSTSTIDIAAIMDADVNENQPNTNNGTSQQLELRRQSGAKDSEAFVGFNFALPPGSIITDAQLKAYLYTAPTPNTNYAVSRVTGAWNEGSVTWNSKPAVAAPTDTESTGDGNAKWMSWDVTSDVAGFVNGSFLNYGWKLADVDAIPQSGSRSGKFRSSEHQSQSDVRPVLEVAIDAPVAPTTHMVVNEVFYDVDSGNGSDANNEWIELYNPTAAPIDISGWDICDNASCDTIPLATTPVPAYGFAVITNDASTFSLHWTDIPASAVKIALGSSLGNGLADAGDRVILRDAADAVVDQVSYGTDTVSLNPSVGITGLDGKSIARVVKGWDTDSASDWILNSTPNPGTNPGSDDIEILRFTMEGVEVAPISEGLEALPEMTDAEIEALIAEEVAEIVEEQPAAAPVEAVEGDAMPQTPLGSSETAPSGEVAKDPTDLAEVREEDVLPPEPTDEPMEQETEEIISEEKDVISDDASALKEEEDAVEEPEAAEEPEPTKEPEALPEEPAPVE